MYHFIDLTTWQKCAVGHQREIYADPQNPSVLVKVVKASGRGERGARKSSRKFQWLRRFRRFGAYMTFRREIDEYLEQARKLEDGEIFDLPIPRILGLTHTSNGLGMVVERIANRSGELSPTIRQLALNGDLTHNHMRLLDGFFDRCRESHIVLMDVNANNFVITDRSGEEQLFCIDGTGEKHFFHIYATSRRLNAIRLRAARKKLLVKIERAQQSARLSVRSEPLRITH